MLSLLAMVLRDDWFAGALTGKAVLMGFAPLTAVAIFVAGQRLFSTAAGWLAATIHLSTPWIYRISIIAYAEGGLTFYLFVSLLAAVRAVDEFRVNGSARPFLLVGLFAGSAMACKYPGVLQVVIPMGIVAVATPFLHKGEGGAQWKAALGCGSVLAAGTLIAVGPWLVKNSLETGNPVYPLAYSVFGGADWDDAMNAKWRAGHSPDNHEIADLGVKFVDVTLKSDWLSPLLFCFAPLSLLSSEMRKRAGWLWLYVTFLFLAWWVFTHRIDRFWVPMIPVVSLLAGAGATWNRSTSWRRLCGTVMIVAVVYNLGYITSRFSGYNAYLKDIHAAREAVTPPVIRYLNRELPKNAKVLCVGEAEVFDARFPLVYNTVFDRSIFEEWFGKSAEGVNSADKTLRSATNIRATLAKHKITHVFVNWAEIERYRQTYGYTEFVTRERFQALQAMGVLGESASAARTPASVKETAVIQIWLGGGPSQFETFDPKPEAPVEFRGPYDAISTRLPGISFCEKLPQTAQSMHRAAVIRTVAHSTNGHFVGAHWCMSGYAGTTGRTTHPSSGAVASRFRGASRKGMPAYVLLTEEQTRNPEIGSVTSPAYLGAQHSPFTVFQDPFDWNYQPEKLNSAISSLKLADDLSLDRVDDRRSLLKQLDRFSRNAETVSAMRGVSEFNKQALDMVTSGAARRAFDLSRESTATRDRYGRHRWGQMGLLARRLVESGVTFVTINTAPDSLSWDWHLNIVDDKRPADGSNGPSRGMNITGPRLDQMLSALIHDLYERGLDRKVLLLVWGEFGRTPRVNKTGGRDHWGALQSILLAGGGLKVGQVIGESNAKGEIPVRRPVHPTDVLATFEPPDSPLGRVLLVIGDAAEVIDTMYPWMRLQEAGYEVVVAAPDVRDYSLVLHQRPEGWDITEESAGYRVHSDIAFRDIEPAEYAGILISGGRAPEYLRYDEHLLKTVRWMAESGRPIGSVCHGIEVLALAGVIKGKRITTEKNMYLQRYYLECLSHASYMVADETTKVAAVIDPQRDIDIYLNDAKEHGFDIKYVILTHFHADFVAGHIELRDRVGAEIVLGARAQAEFEFRPLGDKDAIEFGDVRLEALETPGHTPEGITILAFDKTRDPQAPYAAFTGDTLFIGDVGRPDLLASIGVTANELAEMLYDSLQNKLLKLPDETLVYPAHGAGSMCGKALSDEVVSTIGEQRRYNYALQPMPKEEFIQLVEADQPEAPGYFVHDAILNRQERASLDESMSGTLKALDLDEVLKLKGDGAQLIDTRSPLDFAGAHLSGAINIDIDGKYATWAGTIIDRESPIVVIADDERVAESVMRLGRIGFDHVAGYLQEGMDALADRPNLLEHTNRITAASVGELDDPKSILDVRTKNEWDQGHIEGSINIPLNQLLRQLDEIPEDGNLVVHCQGGYRSSIAASLRSSLSDRRNSAAMVVFIGALLIGITLGLLGSGGSILTVPVLVYLLGHGGKVAIAESLAIVGGIALVGTIPYAQSRQVDWHSVAFFGIPGMAGAYAGAWLAEFISGTIQLLLFAVVMLIAAVLMYRNVDRSADTPDTAGRTQPFWKIGIEGFVVGVVTGLVGVGGGFLIVPALVLLGGLSMRLAVGTSLAIIALKSFSGFFKYHFVLRDLNLSVDWTTIAAFVGVGIVGTFVGRKIGSHINQSVLQKAFAGFLVLMGVFVFAREIPNVIESLSNLQNPPLSSEHEPEAKQMPSGGKEMIHHHVVIVGGGTAGLTVAARLTKGWFNSTDVAVIEPSDKHYYQPLWTLVGAGAATREQTERNEAAVMPRKAEWIQDAVAEFHPDENYLLTHDGLRIGYDWLVVAAGIQINWSSVKGLKETLGKNGVCSNYSYETVNSTWENIRSFKGGTAVFTQPTGAIKCGGAPQKICYLAEDYFRKQGIRDQCRVVFASPGQQIFAVDKYRIALEDVVRRKAIETMFGHNLIEVRPETREAVFRQLDTNEDVVVKYDMLHVTPPMSAPDFIARSPLADADGWVEVDRDTLRHTRFPNVFSLGDCSNLPTSKTGAAVRKQAPVLVKNLHAAMSGKPLAAHYNGYTSCPVVTGYGSLILAEFDYDKNPDETFPFNQAKERRSMYLLKKYILPLLYWKGMLKGRA
eukprot:g26724.t1